MPNPMSRRLLSRRELRFVSRGATVVVTAGLLAVGAWLTPWSPGAMDHAADLAAHGDTQAAIGVYLDIADGKGFPQTRADARWAAAWLASVDAERPQQAVDLLRDFTRKHPDDPRVAQAWGRLGTMYSLYLHDDVRAAEAWQAAAASGPDHEDAGDWLLDAGIAYSDAGLAPRAVEVLTLAAAHPDTAVAAQLALGRLALGTDPATAYDHYSRALRQATEPADASLARLGIATALESLDRVDQALAELGSGDPGDAALTRRRARLEARDRR